MLEGGEVGGEGGLEGVDGVGDVVVERRGGLAHFLACVFMTVLTRALEIVKNARKVLVKPV